MLLGYMTQFAILDAHDYAALTTFRHDGQPVTTPFLFARVDDRLYLMAAADEGEVRRIHENAQVEVAPCALSGQPLGSALEAMALVLTNDKAAAARRALRRKYGLQARLRELTLIVRRERPVYLEITPM